ncbi:hypothetical protein BZG36_02534 [Bifiguratus adelaidae]|uniref:Copper acquisition factor BIM1-like domain-containing protein n=1 Tax=Bifiguratus adelaidae TaxID=1938954 RepID=A0A261Y2A1_9FUNG|nr:hypothetical protein BZG36_02534 [Bifiguratus adelaidae]
MVLSALALTWTVSAHYQLTYPASRGFIDTSEPTAPCGGFNNVNTTRFSFPLHNGFVVINSEHVQASIQMYLVIGNNPSTQAFNQNTTIDNLSIKQPGLNCLSANLANVTGAADGVNATIQLLFNAGDGILYQCADVTLSSSASLNQSECPQLIGGSSNSSSSPSGSASASSGSASASPSGSSGSSGASTNSVAMGTIVLLASVAFALGMF